MLPALRRIRAPWSMLACLAFLVMGVREIDRSHRWRDLSFLNWDSETYYHYLPATFIHQDLLHLAYVESLDSVLHPSFFPNAYGIHTVGTTGNRFIKYTCGTAVFELPLFFLAHAYCHLPGTKEPANGYSSPYQHAVALSSLLFVFLGLLVLRALLLRHYRDPAVTITLVALGLGTNLFYYSTTGGGMSHPYLFFLV
ncbi:MAG: hypothetical protein IPK99_18255, partial [Flavobacteriales bacterium]|nr:hypothetical protein [Flavobacteriales bacterium]